MVDGGLGRRLRRVVCSLLAHTSAFCACSLNKNSSGQFLNFSFKRLPTSCKRHTFKVNSFQDNTGMMAD